eukprot:Selendium_serpulae@DN6519_c2_g1_i7.p1
MLKSGEVQVLGHEVDVGSFEHSVDEWEHESQDVELEQSQDDKEALQNKWAALNALPSEDALMTEVEAERIRKSVDDSANKKEKRLYDCRGMGKALRYSNLYQGPVLRRT